MDRPVLQTPCLSLCPLELAVSRIPWPFAADGVHLFYQHDTAVILY
jgi:hypothetical protein